MRRLALACVLFSLAAPAGAQTLDLREIAGGYAYLNDPHDEVQFHGWTAGADIGLRGWLSAAAEVCGVYAHVEGFGDDTDLSIHSILGGPRASVRFGPLRESFQLLAGTSRTSGSRFGATEVHRHATLQPGMAVDVPLHGRLWLRAGIDIRLLLGSNDSDHQLRAIAALVYRRRD